MEEALDLLYDITDDDDDDDTVSTHMNVIYTRDTATSKDRNSQRFFKLSVDAKHPTLMVE